MSRVLAIHRYYWPDTPPYASLLRAIAERWAESGHQVEILTSQPSYKPETELARAPVVERIAGVTVRRVRMRPDRTSSRRRLFNVVWFPVVVGLRVLLGPRRDVVMCSTVPPVLLGWAVSAAALRRRSAFVYHCMDLHPEIGRLSGDFSRPLVYQLLARLELATCRRAAAIVVLSEDMREQVLRRDPELASRVVVLTNFELPDFEGGGAPPAPLAESSEALRVVFTGNLGRFQGLETITQGVLEAGDELDAFELVFMGEGAAKPDLQRLVDQAPPGCRDRVRFVPHGTPAEVRALLATADLGLVSLTPEVIRYAFPSKTATYLGAGLPVLVAVEADSSLARLVEDENVGGLLPVRSSTDAAAALARWSERRAELPQLSKNAAALWARSFDAAGLLPRWSRLVENVARTRPVTEERA